MLGHTLGGFVSDDTNIVDIELQHLVTRLGPSLLPHSELAVTGWTLNPAPARVRTKVVGQCPDFSRRHLYSNSVASTVASDVGRHRSNTS